MTFRYQAYAGMPARHRNFILAGLQRELQQCERLRAGTQDQELRTRYVDRAVDIQEEIELIQGRPFNG
jgi:hypothetical protein